jgi:hypothetical protein
MRSCAVDVLDRVVSRRQNGGARNRSADCVLDECLDLDRPLRESYGPVQREESHLEMWIFARK